MRSLVRCAICKATQPRRREKQLDIIDKQKGAQEGAFELKKCFDLFASY